MLDNQCSWSKRPIHGIPRRQGTWTSEEKPKRKQQNRGTGNESREEKTLRHTKLRYHIFWQQRCWVRQKQYWLRDMISPAARERQINKKRSWWSRSHGKAKQTKQAKETKKQRKKKLSFHPSYSLLSCALPVPFSFVWLSLSCALSKCPRTLLLAAWFLSSSRTLTSIILFLYPCSTLAHFSFFFS